MSAPGFFKFGGHLERLFGEKRSEGAFVLDGGLFSLVSRSDGFLLDEVFLEGLFFLFVELEVVDCL